MSMQYIIQVPFKGNILSSITDGKVDFSGALHNNGNGNLTIEEYAAKRDISMDSLKVVDEAGMTAALDQFELDTYLNVPAQVISFDRFIDLLEVMPPINYVGDGQFERFNMCERLTGNITTQVARMGEDCLCLNVDVTKPDTWLARHTFAAAMQTAVGKKAAA